MAKQTRKSDWYTALIKKVGTETVDGKKLWELADEVDNEFGFEKLPRGSRHLVMERFQKSGLVDIVSEGKKVLLSIRDTDGLIKFFEGEKKEVKKLKEPISTEEVKKPVAKEVEFSVSLPKPDKTREAFVKYFKCLRFAARARTNKLDIKTCMKINDLKRIQSRHIAYWAKVVKEELGVSITLPKIYKEGDEVVVEFMNRDEDLLNICNFGVKRYLDYKSLKPENAFGTPEDVKRVYQDIEKKRKERAKVVEAVPTQVVSKNNLEEPTREYVPHRVLTDLDHGVIFFTAELIRSGGINNSVYTADLCATVSKRYGLKIGRKDFEDILRAEPEIDITASAGIAKIRLKGKDSYEKIKKAHGYDVQRKYRILAQINMKPEEISSRFDRLSFKVESEIGQFGYIYSIQCSRSKEDLAVLRSLFSIFRGDDKPFNELGLYNRLREEAKKVEEIYNKSDKDYVADSEAWREEELIRRH